MKMALRRASPCAAAFGFRVIDVNHFRQSNDRLGDCPGCGPCGEPLLLSSCGNYCGQGIPPTPSLWAASGAHPFVESDADINIKRNHITEKKEIS